MVVLRLPLGSNVSKGIILELLRSLCSVDFRCKNIVKLELTWEYVHHDHDGVFLIPLLCIFCLTVGTLALRLICNLLIGGPVENICNMSVTPWSAHIRVTSYGYV